MKVVLLAPTPPPIGGIASWASKMQRVSLKNGWKVELVDEKLIGSRQVFGKNTRKNIFIEVRRCLRIWTDLWKALGDEEVRVVHSCIPAGVTSMLREYVCALLTKIRGRKFIIHYRCTVPNMVSKGLSLFLFRRLTNYSDLAIVLNRASEVFVLRYSDTPVCIIPNFIESKDVAEENTRDIKEKVKRVLYVGGVIESKGCIDIIRVARFFPNIEFRLVGRVAASIENLSKPANVTLCGEKNDEEIRHELSFADLFMFVSYYSGEGFSNALLEAMSNGLPCLVSDWAANSDMIEGSGGYVVEPKDVDSMISSLSHLINDKELRKQQSDWNLEKVKSYYIDNIVVDQYVDAYEKVIS